MKKITLAFFIIISLSSCSLFDKDKHDFIDRKLELNREDYRGLAKKVESQENSKQNKEKILIPDISDVLIAPKPPEIGEGQIVSLSVTEDVPIKDVFMELGRLANIDIEIDPKISGGIIFRAKDKPLNEVIKRICKLAGVRYYMEDDILKVEKDVPYLENYKVPYLNTDRRSQNAAQVTTNVLANTEGSNNGLNSGSKSVITAKTVNDTWRTIGDGLSHILKHRAVEDEKGFYTINKQAGLVSVMATQAQHNQIENFLRMVELNSTSQVLIEAKILEVTLDDTYKSGIKWGPLSDDSNVGINAEFGRLAQASDFVSFTIDEGLGLGLDALVEFTEQFGASRTLSSPRLIALNNEQSILTFAKNEVYFDLDVDRETNTNAGVQTEIFTVDSSVKTVPIGLILSILPSINLDNNEVIINVRPTLSRLTGKVEDPAVSFLLSQQNNNNNNNDDTVIKNEIPIIEVREMDSVLKAKSGQVMVIGGLMEERSVNNDNGVPFVSEIPWVGNAFKGVSKNTDTVEMVILLKATIINNNNKFHPYDEEVYRKFSADPRPLMF